MSWVWDSDEEECNHEGHVDLKGVCGKCGKDGLKSDDQIYDEENPR